MAASLDHEKAIQPVLVVTAKPKTPRPVGRPSNMNDSVRAAIVFLHRDCKIGKRKLANRLGLGVGTVLKVLSEI
jgi:hypothetical protein